MTEYAELNRIKVNLAELRVQIIGLMKDGFSEIPLADLIFIIKNMGEPNGYTVERDNQRANPSA